MNSLCTTLSFALLLALLQSIDAQVVSFPTNLKLSNPSLELSGKVAAAGDNMLPEKASFDLKVGDKDVTIAVERSELFSPDYLEAEMNEQGDIIRSTALDQSARNCYYTGKVVGDSDSQVSLDVCSGTVRGAIYSDKGIFSLEASKDNKSMLGSVWEGAKALLWAQPTQPSVAAAFEKGFSLLDMKDEMEKMQKDLINDEAHHLMEASAAISSEPMVGLQNTINKVIKSHQQDEKTTTTTTTTEETAAPTTTEEISPSSTTNAPADNLLGSGRPKRYIEVILFSDAARVQALGTADIGAANKRIFHLITTYYKQVATQLELNLVLKGNLIFKRDPWFVPNIGHGAQVLGDSGLLQRFLDHVIMKRSSYPSYDVVLLLSGRQFQSNIRGLANIGAVCDLNNGGGITSVTYINELMNASLVAHELAHTLGANHDGQAGAMRCSDQATIMQPYVTPVTRFSQCSIDYFDNFLYTRQCLYNNPMQQPALGNNDAGKDDAGNEQDARKKTHDSHTSYNSEEDNTGLYLVIGLVSCIAVAVCAVIASAVAKSTARKAVQQALDAPQQQTQQQTQQPHVIYVPTPTQTHHVGPVYTAQ